MKVTNNRIGNAAPNRAGGLKSESPDTLNDPGAAGAAGSAGAKDSANVNLSERALRLQRAQGIAGQPAGVDEAKVARLQKMIDAGTYAVDAGAVADRLVDEHLNLPD